MKNSKSKIFFTHYQTHRCLAKRLLRDSDYASLAYAHFLSSLCSFYLSIPNHNKARAFAARLINKDIYIGYYYLALSEFLFARYEKAESYLRLIPDYLQIADVVFLYSDVLYYQNRITEAWRLLEQISKINKRRKVWLLMSNLVTCKKDHQRFIENVQYVKTHTNYLDNHEILNAEVNAAMRSNQSEIALQLLKKQVSQPIKDKQKNKQRIINSMQKRISSIDASTALKALKKTLDKHKIEFFLISGTLLGCIREQDFLAHDKDIDLGVWDAINYQDLVSIVAQSGCFYIIKNRTQELVKIRHVNGTDIDLFIHHKTKEVFWHSAVKLKWSNTPFTLVSQNFLGDQYLIPEDYDLYLTENYGNWRTPKIEFDSTYDTPNAQIMNEVEMEIYKLKQALL